MYHKFAWSKMTLLGAWYGDPHLLCDVEAVWMSTLKAEVLGLNAWWKSHIFWRDFRRTEPKCPMKRWTRPLMARGSLRHNRFPVIVNWQEQLAKQAKMAEAGAVWPAKENMSIRVGALGEYRTYATLHKHEQARLFKALLSYLTCLLTCEYEGQLSCSNDCIQAQGIQTSTQVQTWKVRTLHTPIPTKTDVVIIEAYSWKTALRN